MRILTWARLPAVLIVIGLSVLAPVYSRSQDHSVAGAASPGLLPDLRTVVPQHVGIMNEHQREILRFSNGIANTGEGPLRMRPVFPLSGSSGTQAAIQEILGPDGSVTSSEVVSQFEYHPDHNHWHIAGVALFEVRAGAVDGQVFGGNSVKTTFCLIDWYTLEGNSNTKDRTYWDCSGDLQGISPGWVDQYHQSTVGQQLDVTGAPAGRYFLVSTANPDSSFIESDLSNNEAWVSFDLTRDSRGNAKIAIAGHSECEGRMCGDKVPNR